MGYNPATGLYTVEDMSFVNTREFSRAAQYFKKNGVYTKLHPVYDKAEYDAHWDEEEKRRRFGYTVGGVRITGEHYGFLNYNKILRTTSSSDTTGVLKDYKSSKRIGVKNLDFPDFWDGHYHWFHSRELSRKLGLHLIGGKARRKGFSYVGAWSAANNYDLYPDRTTIIGAFDNKYLIRGDGTMALAKKCLNLLNLHTDWYKSRLINLKDHIKSGYKIKGRDEEQGFLSQILAISFKDNPDAGAGKDAYEVDLEELGVFPNLEQVLGIMLPTMSAGTTITGQLIGWGTGGTKGANWEAFESVYYNPGKYGFMAFDNVWDDNARGQAVGFFFPYVQNLEPYMDEDGNSLKEEALAASDAEREEKKKTTTDAASFTLYTGQYANKPSEAFSRSITNIFASKELADHIALVKNDPLIRNLPRVGQLIRTKQGVRLFTNAELEAQGIPTHPPVDTYPHKSDQDVTGCIVEYQPPYRDPKTGKIPRGLYRIWNDPYAQDKNREDITMRDSLGSTFVYERTNTFTATRGDILVAAYTGRPSTMDEYNSNLLKLVEYYGGEDQMLLFENDRGDVKNYFKRMKATHLLADEPEITWKKDLQSSKTGRAKGIMINPARKGTGAVYYRDWIYTKRGSTEDGVPKLNLHYIYDLGLLQELEKWNLKGNFDRVSCMIVGQYDMKEEIEKEIHIEEDSDVVSFLNGNGLFDN